MLRYPPQAAGYVCIKNGTTWYPLEKPGGNRARYFPRNITVVLLVLNLNLGDKPIDRQMRHRYPVSDEQFLRSMGVLLGPPLVPANRVKELLNGEQIFPAMLKAIGSAEQTITFETYIYWSGSIGKVFVDALCERAKSDVKVYVLLDWVGSDSSQL